MVTVCIKSSLKLVRGSLFATIFSAANPASADWTFQAVPQQAMHHGDYARMLIDSGGTVHILMSTFFYASTGDINYHAFDGNQWTRETLWGEYGGYYLSPAVSSEGEVRFLHDRGWKGPGFTLRLATRVQPDWSGWTYETVAPAGEWPAPCALAIDVDGNNHVVFAESTNAIMYYGTFDGQSWSLTSIGEDVTWPMVIGINPAGEPRVAYIDSSGDLRVTTRSNGVWTDQLVFAPPISIAAMDAKFDSAGGLHAALSVREPNGSLSLHYVREVGSTFPEQLVPSGLTQGGVYLALDVQDRPAIVYGSGTPALTYDARFARFDGATWNDQSLTSDGISRPCGLGFLPNDRPVVAIQRGTLNTVMYGSPPTCVGDLNGDNAVDLVDLTSLLANFGVTGGATPAQGDLDGDGDVDLVDLSAMLARFGSIC